MISVIIPVYNSARYLSKCIRSIISQTYTELEIICVNDGSTDDSAQVLEEFSLRDSRVKVLMQDNIGVSAARNAGIDAAKGEYISFVDSDDELEPDMYELLISLAEKYQADISHCGYKKIHLDGSTKDVCGTGELLIQDGLDASRCMLSGEHFTGGLWNKLFRSALIKNTRFDRELKINEDVLFNAQLFKKASIVVFYDVPKYHYFERENSSCSRTNALRKKQDSVVAAEKILQIYKDSPIEVYAAKKLYYCLLDLYRAYLFEGILKKREVCKELHQKIFNITPLCGGNIHRNQVNYFFIHRFPLIYKLIYGLYDHVRKPNWDL